MILRKATLKDIKACADIFRVESSKHPYNKKTSTKKAIDLMKEDFKLNDIYVAEVDNGVVGFIMLKIDPNIKDQLWINELWITQESQGRGIGKKIMAEIEKIYKKKGIKTFKLVAHTNAGGAQKFYKKLNYVVDKNMVFMEKKIK